jgi:hypothetical protein
MGKAKVNPDGRESIEAHLAIVLVRLWIEPICVPESSVVRPDLGHGPRFFGLAML